MQKLLHRITKELAKGKVRRAVPSWSIPRELWRMVLRPRDPDIQETNKTNVTEADLNNRLLQTTSSKELLAIMREIRERQVANGEVPNQSWGHLPSDVLARKVFVASKHARLRRTNAAGHFSACRG